MLLLSLCCYGNFMCTFKICMCLVCHLKYLHYFSKLAPLQCQEIALSVYYML